jgi:hypothetical protein
MTSVIAPSILNPDIVDMKFRSFAILALLFIPILLQSCMFYKYNNINLVEVEPVKVLHEQIYYDSDSSYVVVYSVNDTDTASILLTDITILEDSISFAGIAKMNNQPEKYSWYYEKAKHTFETKNDDNERIPRKDKIYFPQTHIYTNDSLIVDDTGRLCITKEQITSMQTLNASDRLALVIILPIIGLVLLVLLIVAIANRPTNSPTFGSLW